MRKLFIDIKLASSIAFTHMQAKFRQIVVATFGVAFGISVFIFMVSFIMGSKEYTENIAFEQSPHLRFYNEAQLSDQSVLDRAYPSSMNIVHHQRPKDILPNLKDGLRNINEIRQDTRVSAVSGSLITQVFFRLSSSAVNGMITGVVFEDENTLFNLNEKIVEGGHEELTTLPNSLLMGTGLAKKLNVAVGDKVRVTTEKGDSFMVTIIGLFKTGLVEIDEQHCYASLKTVQTMLSVPASYITAIKVKLHDKEEAPELSRALQQRYHYSGSDWKRDNAALVEADFLYDLIVYGVSGAILLVAGFGIFNILTMMIYEKMKDIAILKAMGFSDVDVRWIFLIQAFSIGIVGAILGLGFGYLLAYATSRVPYGSDVMVTMDYLPVSFKAIYYITGFTFGILTTALSGYLPSRKAANVDPIAILRG